MPPEPIRFDLGEYAGIGLDSRQICFLAGVLFFGIFAVIAMRRAGNAGGLWAAVWSSAAIALVALGIHIAGRGLGEHLPPWLTPLTDRETLQHAAILGVTGCWAFVFLSAHWVNDSLAKWFFRVLGLAMAGAGVWQGVAWFRHVLPEEAHPYATRELLLQAGVAIGLLLLAVALWVRGRHSSPHSRWAFRSLVPLVIGGVTLLALDQFAREIPEDWRSFPFRRVIVSLTGIGVGCGLLITVGAWLMRDRPAPELSEKPKRLPDAPKPAPANKLPVAALLDDQGRPVVPPARRS